MKERTQWPAPSLSKAELVEKIAHTVAAIPGQNYELQPIQMRSNELLAGVRVYIAIKVFGDGFAPMLQTCRPSCDPAAHRRRLWTLGASRSKGCRFWLRDLTAMPWRVGPTAEDLFLRWRQQLPAAKQAPFMKAIAALR